MIGRRAAALVIGNRIVGAVAIGKHVEITAEPQHRGLRVENLRVGAAPDRQRLLSH